MKKPTILHIATELVTEGPRHGSPSMIKRRLRQDHGIDVSFEVARAILAQLYGAGIVGKVDLTTHAHPVLMDRDQAVTTITEFQTIGATDWSGLYECPQCSRMAPWTDGRMRTCGDPEDEFWCQTCGAETPLSTCARTELLLA
ncbi:hypothetical protein ACWD4T_48340 [Streptomyces umbrinus]